VRERDALLDAHVRPVAHRLRKRIARHDRAVRAEPLPFHRARAQVAQVAAVRGCGPVARTRVMDATQLKAVADLPDPVQHDPMALIAFGQAPFASEILSEREWHFDWRPAGHAHERRADRVPETTERIRARRLP